MIKVEVKQGIKIKYKKIRKKEKIKVRKKNN
jgi:hypothetical protein